MQPCRSKALPMVEEVCQDEATLLALSVSRFLAAGYMTRDVACVEAACDAAEHILGPAAGHAFIGAMTGVMRAIRAERVTDWTFMPATCCRVTPDEQALLGLLELARRRSREAVEIGAARLADGHAAPRLAEAVLAAAASIDKAQAALRSGAPADRARPAVALH